MIRNGGGYRRLSSFQLTTVIYDATVSFCGRFIDSYSRTVDQMVQAARSGRQNIAEASLGGRVCSQTELKLLNVARASLEELLLDYEDYLRQKGLPEWGKDSPESVEICDIWQKRTQEKEYIDFQGTWRELDDIHIAWYKSWFSSDDPKISANASICLIHQASYLLDRQLSFLEKKFIEEGGYHEFLYHQHRDIKKSQSEEAQTVPCCPKCGRPMRRLTAKRGPNAGQHFWSCSAYPDCDGTRPFPD